MRLPIQGAAVARRASSVPVGRLPHGGVGPLTKTQKELQVFGFDPSETCAAKKHWCFCQNSPAAGKRYACCDIKDMTDGSKSCDQKGTGDCTCV
jgi:hypothetical protein